MECEESYRITFEELLDCLHVQPGGTYFVHSDWFRLTRFGKSHRRIIEILQNRIGESGVICMPTYPFIRKEHPRPIEIRFDPGLPFSVRNTPSRVGLLTEIFRRSPNVLRSAHPWVPVAVWGKNASDYVDEIHKVRELYEENSTFGRLLAADVQVLGLGVSVGNASFAHCAEWTRKQHLPYCAFEYIRAAQVQTMDGTWKDLTFEIVPERIQSLMAVHRLFEKDKVLARNLRFENVNENFFFSYDAETFVRAGQRELDACLAAGTYPCWFKSDPCAL